MLPQWTYEMFFDHVIPEDRPDVDTKFRHAIGTWGDWNFECRIRRTDGETRWIWAVGRHRDGSSDRLSRVAGIVQDITERKRAEEEVRQSEEKFRVLFTRMTEGSALHELVYDASGDPVDYRILDVNPAFERILGLKREDVMGKTSREVYGVATPPYFELYCLVAETGHPEDFEVFFPPLNMHFAVSAYSPEHGKFATVFTDITGRRNAEEKIANLASIVESSDDAIIGKSLGGIITSWNAGAGKIYGYSPEEVIGRNISILIPPGQSDDREYLIDKIGRGEPFAHYETQRIKKDGTLIPVSLTLSPVRDRTGKLIGASTIVRDITDRKNAETALRESEERHRLLSETMLQGVVHQDASGYIIAMNPAAERILGKTRERFLGSSSVKEERDTIRENGEPFPGTEHPAIVALRTDLPVRGVIMGVFNPVLNMLRWISIDAVPVFHHAQAEPSEVYTVFEDITGRKNAEDELKRRHDDLNAAYEELPSTQEELRQTVDDLTNREQQLTDALAEKEVLLAEIHHRVKNNLTAFISLLSLDGSTEETPAGRELKKDLQNRARSMALIHETLYRTHQFSNVDMEHYLTPLVEQVVISYRSSQAVMTIVEARGVALDIGRATPTGLIINELVTNSLKHAFPPDEIGCRPDQSDPCTIVIRMTREGESYLLSVSDNGIGMPAGFDPLTARSLGLKLVNFLAKHQLRSTVEVVTGKGTEFVFRFGELLE
jgi:PAS domain S-box-containing protein